MDIKIKIQRDATYIGGYKFEIERFYTSRFLVFKIKKSIPEWELLESDQNPVSERRFFDLVGVNRSDIQCFTYNFENHEVIKRMREGIEISKYFYLIEIEENEKEILYHLIVDK